MVCEQSRDNVWDNDPDYVAKDSGNTRESVQSPLVVLKAHDAGC